MILQGQVTQDGTVRLWPNLKWACEHSPEIRNLVEVEMHMQPQSAWRLIKLHYPRFGFCKQPFKKTREEKKVAGTAKEVLGETKMNLDAWYKNTWVHEHILPLMNQEFRCYKVPTYSFNTHVSCSESMSGNVGTAP